MRNTGGRITKKVRKAAVALADKFKKLPKSLETIVNGQLYFIALAPEVYEGEMRVGLARAEESCESCEKEASEKEIAVRWLARREWLKKRLHKWKCPSFEYARNPNNPRSTRYSTVEKLQDFLPLKPELTDKCGDLHPRLQSRNVVALKELCRRRGLLSGEREKGEESEEESDYGEEEGGAGEEESDDGEEEGEEDEVEGESEGESEEDGEKEGEEEEGGEGEEEGGEQEGEEEVGEVSSSPPPSSALSDAPSIPPSPAEDAQQLEEPPPTRRRKCPAVDYTAASTRSRRF